MTARAQVEGIALTEVSQTEKDKYCVSHLHVESKKADLEEIESRMVMTRVWESGGRGVGEKLAKGYKLPDIRRMNSGDLIYSVVTINSNPISYF